MPEPAVPTDWRVALRSLGCKVNQAESEAIAGELLGESVSIVAEEHADVVVVNTCTVTGEADAKARKAVRQCLSASREPVVVVTGCLAVLDAEGLRSLGERVVVEADKARVSAAVVSALEARCATPPPRVAAGEPGGGVRAGQAGLVADVARDPAAEIFRTRVALKVEDGCDNVCTYCIVPAARGLPRAVPLGECVASAERLVAAGTQELVLTGINIGRYHDPETGADLAELIGALAATGITRLRLSSIEPPDLTPRLLAAMAATPAFCAHLHVPLQTGSDAVLAAMGRLYDTATYSERIVSARAALPGLVVTTDVIAGFPGETAENAAETLAFCSAIGFGKLHVFRYSRRPGTPAAERSDQVPDAVKSRRAAALRDLSASQVSAHARRRIGRTAEVLVERLFEAGESGTSLATGTTRDYLRVRFRSADAAPGDLRAVTLTGLDGDVVLGELVG